MSFGVKFSRVPISAPSFINYVILDKSLNSSVAFHSLRKSDFVRFYKALYNLILTNHCGSHLWLLFPPTTLQSWGASFTSELPDLTCILPLQGMPLLFCSIYLHFFISQIQYKFLKEAFLTA